LQSICHLVIINIAGRLQDLFFLGQFIPANFVGSGANQVGSFLFLLVANKNKGTIYAPITMISLPGVELSILANPLYFDLPGRFGYKKSNFSNIFLLERELPL